MLNVAYRRVQYLVHSSFWYTAISIYVVGSKHRARTQDLKVMWDFFLNKFMKTSYASPVQWRFMMASHLDERNSRISSRWGSGCFEDGNGLGVRPYCRTRKHQWALFRSCVNWLVNLSSDEGDTNENITWKYKLILFVLLFSITLTRLNSTEMANYSVTKLVGVTLKLRKLNEKFAILCSCSQQNLEFRYFTFMLCRGWQRNVTKFETLVQSFFCSSEIFCFVALSLPSLLSLLSFPIALT